MDDYLVFLLLLCIHVYNLPEACFSAEGTYGVDPGTLAVHVPRPTPYTMPAPQTNVIFYQDSTYLGALGAGSNFFFVGCSREGVLRAASTDELSAFAGLVGTSW